MTLAATDPVSAILGSNGAVAKPPLGTPTFERHGDEFSLRWADYTVEMWLTALRESSEGLHAELAVKHDGREIHWGRLNLASTSAREGLVKKLQAARAADGDGEVIPWRDMLERACRSTADAVRQGTPTLLLRPRLAEGPRFLVEPILPLGDTAVIFGDGGSGKGYVALAFALAVQHGAGLPGGITATRRARVLYLDWESTPDEIEERLYLLGRGLSVPAEGIQYRRMSRALDAEAPALRAEVSRLGAGLVIVDSLGPACGVEPEGADAAVRVFNALRAFGTGVTRLVIAHVSKTSAEQRTGPARPYGSVYVQNLARSVWELRRSDEQAGDDLVVALYHRKTNRGCLHAPIGLRFAFADDAITVNRGNLGESPDLLARASLVQRICTVLATGALTAEEIAEHLQAEADTVGRTLRRLASKGRIVRLPENGHVRWGLGV